MKEQPLNVTTLPSKPVLKGSGNLWHQVLEFSHQIEPQFPVPAQLSLTIRSHFPRPKQCSFLIRPSDTCTRFQLFPVCWHFQPLCSPTCLLCGPFLRVAWWDRNMVITASSTRQSSPYTYTLDSSTLLKYLILQLVISLGVLVLFFVLFLFPPSTSSCYYIWKTFSASDYRGSNNPLTSSFCPSLSSF